MKRKIIWATLGVALIAVGITAAWTQTRTWHGARSSFWCHHGPMGYVAHELDLSDTQKAQIKTIWQGERPNISELVREFAAEQKEMDALTFQNGARDEGRIQDITAQQGATVAKLIREKEEVTGKIYSQVLNPAQRTKADELRKHWTSLFDHIADRIGNATDGK
jgi:Spy/CpxP family protein refolding chaperone